MKTAKGRRWRRSGWEFESKLPGAYVLEWSMYVIVLRERVHTLLARGVQLHPTPQPPD